MLKVSYKVVQTCLIIKSRGGSKVSYDRNVVFFPLSQSLTGLLRVPVADALSDNKQVCVSSEALLSHTNCPWAHTREILLFFFSFKKELEVRELQWSCNLQSV